MRKSQYQIEFQNYLWSSGDGFDWRWVLAGSLLFSIWCLVVLLRSRVSWVTKIGWGMLTLFPIVGPLMFAALFRPPPRLDESERLRRTPGP